MQDLTQMEIDAIMAASDPAGAYLERLGKTDLAVLSQDEWHEFLATVVAGYCDAMRGAADRGEVPF